MKSTLELIDCVEVGEHCLHLFKEAQDPEWQVWLDTEVAELDGLCISVAHGRELAVELALQKLANLTANILKLKG